MSLIFMSYYIFMFFCFGLSDTACITQSAKVNEKLINRIESSEIDKKKTFQLIKKKNINKK